MFSRSPPADPKPISGTKTVEPFKPGIPRQDAENNTPPPMMPAAPGGTTTGFSLGSIIGNDLTIVGQGLRIITRGTLQVDGKIEGDVVGTEVIIGEKGEVVGVVSADSVIVRGQVQGTIKGKRVALQSSAHVEGDVHHQELTVEQGAHLDGRVRRPKDPAELEPDLNPIGRAAS